MTTHSKHTGGSSKRQTAVEGTSSGSKKQPDSQIHDPTEFKVPSEEDSNLAHQEDDSLDVFKTNICLNNFSIYDNQFDISH